MVLNGDAVVLRSRLDCSTFGAQVKWGGPPGLGFGFLVWTVLENLSQLGVAFSKNRGCHETQAIQEWWFAIVDVVGVLTDSVQPEGYV